MFQKFMKLISLESVYQCPSNSWSVVQQPLTFPKQLIDLMPLRQLSDVKPFPSF